MGVAASRNEMAVNSKRSLDTTVNLMSKRNVALSASESCWEGENCSYCKVPSLYNKELVVVPTPLGGRINHGMTATVFCKDKGKTFINSVLAVNGVSQKDIYFNQAITIKCKDGTLTPAIFEDSSWCKYGCPKIPDTTYKVSYPDLTFQTDLSLPPIYTDSTKDIKIECKSGYSDAVGDRGTKNVRCTSSGYTRIIRTCVEGCDYPVSDGLHTLGTQPNFEKGSAYYPVKDNSAVSIKCDGSSNAVPLYCMKGVGWVNTDLLTCGKTASFAAALTTSLVLIGVAGLRLILF